MIHQTQQSIGEFLRHMREDAGLSPAEAATYLEMDAPERVLQMEAGGENVSLGIIYACANVYNTPTDDIMRLLLDLPGLIEAPSSPHVNPFAAARR